MSEAKHEHTFGWDGQEPMPCACVVATTRNGLYRNVTLDQRGLVYAVNHWDHSPSSGPSSGKLVLVPMSKLLTALSK